MWKFPTSNLDTVGNVHRSLETHMKWTIPHFSELSDKVDDYYESSGFFYSNVFWCLRIFPNGQNHNHSQDYIGVYLGQKGSPTNCTVHFTACLKNADGSSARQRECTAIFPVEIGFGFPKFCKKFKLLRKKSELLPGDVLTIYISLKDYFGSLPLDKVPLKESLLNTNRNMLEILMNKLPTDIVLKVDGVDIKAHSIILESRSEVFQKMLSHDMVEKRTGEIVIDDVETEVMEEVLNYMYGGLVQMTSENALRLYVVADKYNLQDLKTLCSTYMEDNMSNDLFWDAFMVADAYDDAGVMQVVKEYLVKHSEIIETEKWKEFESENRSMAVKILSMYIKEQACKNEKNLRVRINPWLLLKD